MVVPSWPDLFRPSTSLLSFAQQENGEASVPITTKYLYIASMDVQPDKEAPVQRGL
jgi:hypothetical protein